MSTLGKAVIEFSADTARFVGDVGAAASKFDRSMVQMQRGVESLRNAFLALGAVGGIGAVIKGSIDAGDQLAKLSQKVGVSVERLSELKLAAELGGVDLNTFATGMREFNRSLVEAQDTSSKAAQIFKQMGVDVAAGPDAAFRQFAESISKMPDGAAKTTVAMELLGRAGAELIPMLNGGAKGFDDAAEKARKLGLVFGTETAKRAEQLNDQMHLLTRNTEALGLVMADKLASPLATITEKLLEAHLKGDLVVESLKEIGKVALATAEALTRLPEKLPWWFLPAVPLKLANKGLEMAADAAFKEKPVDPWAIARANILKSQQGTWTGAPEFGDAGPNAAALARILGGAKTGGGGGKSIDNVAAQQAAAMQQVNEIMEEAERLGVQFLQTQEKKRLNEQQYFEDLERRTETERMLAIYARQEERDTEVRERYMAERIKQTKELDDVARQLGFTFSSAFEDAIIEGKKFSDVLKGLARDIGRLVLREAVTKPAASAITKLVESFDFGKFFRADGGPVSAGQPYIVGERGPELFTPGASGMITPNHALGGMTLVSSPQIHIDSRTDQSQVMRLVRSAVEQGNAMLLDQMRRGATQAAVAVGRA